MGKIAVIDDDRLLRKVIGTVLKKEGYNIVEAENGEKGMELILKENPDVVISDYFMPIKNGLELLAEMRALKLGIPLIMLTGYGDIALTIKSIQHGAFDFLEKPVNPGTLKNIVERALHSVKQSAMLTKKFDDIGNNLLIGKTRKMKEIFKNVGLISMNKVNVLIQGETGTGKELIARLIHYSGITKDEPLVVVNCSALTETLLESELFGHVKGAFTDSIRDKKGKFELAGEGTIFLDEISEVSLNTQVKLLRVIQELEFERVGGESTIPMKARITWKSLLKRENLGKTFTTGSRSLQLHYPL